MRTVVVGAGAAGLWCALHAARRGDVIVVAPDPAAGSSTALAQGGIAAAVAEGDDPAAHAADTIAAGAGLCDPEAVRVLTEEGRPAIEELLRMGMAFDEGGAPTLEGGHSARRVLHAGGDATGRALLSVLLKAVGRDDRISRIDARADRIMLEGGRAAGVATELDEVEGDRVVLATGGFTGIFGRRTGPERTVGEGLALAWDAGAALADLEFVQFHPTALAVAGHPARLLTEALRGEGALLLDGEGGRFMPTVDPRAELAPRDVVARAIAEARERTGAVVLDARGIQDVSARFPTAAATCAATGLDLARDPIPVAPAAHYTMGGVFTDAWGRSTIPGLAACGEVACTGVHGANRLASNSLLEALVFGRRAAEAEDGSPVVHPAERLGEAEPPAVPLEQVRGVTDRRLGVARDADGLEAALVELRPGERGPVGGEPTTEGGRAATLPAWLLARAALAREESRGAHQRTDHPVPDDRWRVRQAWSRTGRSRLAVDPAVSAAHTPPMRS